MRWGFLYLVAVMDWASRKVLSRRLSNRMEVEFYSAGVTDAMGRSGAPYSFNIDQGNRFTSPRPVPVLQNAGIHVSMDERGLWMDNVLTEPLWRPLRYDCVYLHAFETTSELWAGLAAWVRLYDEWRPRSAAETPDKVLEDETGDVRETGNSLTKPPNCPGNRDHLKVFDCESVPESIEI